MREIPIFRKKLNIKGENMKKIGLVVAMEEEMREIYATLGKLLKIEQRGLLKISIFDNNGMELYLIGSGIGEISAAIAATVLINEYKVDAIINFGVVGSISGKYKSKDIVVVDEIVHYDFTFSVSDKEQYGKYTFNRNSFVNKIDDNALKVTDNVLSGIPKARLATADKFIDSAKFKNELLQRFGADICDMESMGLFLACRNWSVPLFMIKAVSDDADESAQLSFDEIINSGVKFYIKAVNQLIGELKKID